MCRSAGSPMTGRREIITMALLHHSSSDLPPPHAPAYPASRPRTDASIMRTQKSSPRGSLARVSPYYAATAHPAPARAELADGIECDVCVVGGGLAGCSTALHLAQRGYRVEVLEQH